MQLSNSENVFIREGIIQNLRADGRKRFQARNIDVQFRCLSNSDGSSQLFVDSGNVLVGILCSIHPESDFGAAVFINGKKDPIFTSIVKKGIDESSISISSPDFSWYIRINVTTIGDVTKDHVSHAVKAALLTVMVPAIRIQNDEVFVDADSPRTPLVVDGLALVQTFYRIDENPPIWFIDRTCNETCDGFISCAISPVSVGPKVVWMQSSGQIAVGDVEKIVKIAIESASLVDSQLTSVARKRLS